MASPAILDLRRGSGLEAVRDMPATFNPKPYEPNAVKASISQALVFKIAAPMEA